MESKEKKEQDVKDIVRLSRYVIYLAVIFLIVMVIEVITIFRINDRQPVLTENNKAKMEIAAPDLKASAVLNVPVDEVWQAPDTSALPLGNQGKMIRYGRELIVHTSSYLGPQGSVAKISNGMNCQNCHLNGGTKPFANNFSVFFVNYPKLSNRSGRVEPAFERVKECFERSLNGKSPRADSKEMLAILAYLKWVGKDTAKGQKIKGQSVEKLPYLENAADPLKGQVVYVSKCQSCHGNNGEGILAENKKSYVNPPLWGIHSYNDGAGMYRLINFSGFVKNNMPFGASYQNTQLTDEEAWNVAAYVNSQPRPHKNQESDYKVLSKKPIDFPFSPYDDKFSEKQHKFGPFKPIEIQK